MMILGVILEIIRFQVSFKHLSNKWRETKLGVLMEEEMEGNKEKRMKKEGKTKKKKEMGEDRDVNIRRIKG